MMLLGLPVGMYLFRSQQSDTLNLILAVFIIIVSVTQLYRQAKKRTGNNLPPTGYKALPYYLLLFLGGIVHGVFSSGGPLVVLYATRALPDKGKFRATLCLLWTTLNTIIIAGYIIEGSLTPPVVKNHDDACTFVVGGIIAGEYIHDKVDARHFSLIVFSMLLTTGIVMLLFAR